MLNLQISSHYHFANPVILDFDMLGPAVKLGLCSEMNSSEVVAFEDGGIRISVTHSAKHRTKPEELLASLRDGAVLSLR